MANREKGSTHVSEADFNKSGFWFLNLTQAQGAFNDNLFKYLIVFYLFGVMPETLTYFGASFNRDEFVPQFATVVFSLPFIIFPAMFGALADRYSKQRVALATKYLEIAIMFMGGVAFYWGNPYLIFGILFMMAAQSAMFGPAKYGILPEILPESRLSWGNGIIQMCTMVAIIAGIGIAGPVYKIVNEYFDGQIYLTGGVLMLFSALGTVTAHFITKPPAANPTKRIPMNPLLPWSGMGLYFKTIWHDRVLFNVVVGYVYFWFASVLMQNNVISFAKGTLNLSETVNSLLLATIAIAIGLGALFAGFLSRGKIETGLVPLASVGMMVFATLVSYPQAEYDALLGESVSGAALLTLSADSVITTYILIVLFSLFGLGFFAGMFDVPLAASIQQRAPMNMKGGVIATTNMLTFVGMFFAALFGMAMSLAGISTYQVFFLSGFLSLIMGIYISVRLPFMIVRTILWLVNSTVCRLKTLGGDNLPDSGGALLVANNGNIVDTLFILASTDRHVRFVVGNDLLVHPKWKRIAKWIGAIGFDPEGSDEEAVKSTIRTLLQEGHTVCISTESPCNSKGERISLVRNFGALLESIDVPLIPVNITRLRATLFEVFNGEIKWRNPPRIPHPIVVNYGKALPSQSTLADIQAQLRALEGESYSQRPLIVPLLHRAFFRSAKRNLRRPCAADLTSGQISYFKALVGTIAFARKLNVVLDKQPMVGVLVPPSVGGLLANIALPLMGRVPINLNYTTSAAGMKSTAEQCNLTQVLTSKKFLEKLPLEVPGEAIFLEDIKASISGKDRIIAMALAFLVPVKVLEKMLGAPKRTSEDVATIIFSSGSEGEPKGIQLTHRNLIANIESAVELFPHDKKTCMVGFLPFFHSFGFMGTIWLPMIHGFSAAYHPNPLEPKQIGDLIKKYKGSIVIGTSTFYQAFNRRCTKEQLESLDLVIAGAEKLSPRVRTAFLEKFDIEIMEGYGTTECSPGVASNIKNCKSPGFFEKRCIPGTIGKLLPGQNARVANPDTGEILGVNEPGMLYIKGPNIMTKGYLHQEEKTAKVLKDGWYETGDMAMLNEDGFITITDRLARFSKIGGEMVPHTKIEESLHTVLGLVDQMLAVASVPDAAKGERLVVLHTLDDEQLAELIKRMPEAGLPNLWLPRSNAFHRIEAIPVLGTGKLDLKSVKRMAAEFEKGD